MDLNKQLTQLLPHEPGKIERRFHGRYWCLTFADGTNSLIDTGEGWGWSNAAPLEYWLRERILARGWVAHYDTPDWNNPQKIRALIFVVNGRELLSAEIHHEPAIALLRAYLMAMGCDIE